jgi:gamma-glutamyltranspeptidase / glutathione hydrolase
MLAVMASDQAVSGTFGVVASSHWIASQVGMGILEKGGNAFDAAVAAGFAMQVVEPHQNGLGGDVVIIAYPGKADIPKVICGQGVAPSQATVQRYESLGLDVVPGRGFLSAVVPGAFDAWMLLLRDYGSMYLDSVLQPAISYAESGFPLSKEAVKEITKAEPLFRAEWPSSARVYLSHNTVPVAGRLFCNTTLAQTYLRLLRSASNASTDRCMQIEAARTAFYKGFVAEAIDRFFRIPIATDLRGERLSGLLNGDDLSAWAATVEDPISAEFRGFTIFKPGFWTQGPALLQILAMAVDSNIFESDPLSAEYVHWVTEASKLAYADREAWYGDSESVSEHRLVLLSNSYARSRSTLISEQASTDIVAGRIGDALPRLPRYRVRISGGAAEEVASRRSSGVLGGTCHIDVIDKWGNAVAATPSAGWLHGSPTIPELGFSITNRGQMFWLQKDLASTLQPRTRPRTTLSPSAAITREGHKFVFGSRGGDYQDQWILQSFLMHAVFGMDLQSAVDAPRFHSDHWPRSEYPRDANPGKLTLEDRFSPQVVKELHDRGHTTRIHEGRRWGRNCVACKDDRLLMAAISSSIPQARAVGR